MITCFEQRKKSLPYRVLSVFVAFTFIFSTILPTPGFAQTVVNLPVPGAMVPMTPGFAPAVIKGVTVHPENPLEFDFIVYNGDSGLEGEALQAEAKTLVKYFLAALTVPEDEMWVNLSPYEKDKIIPEGFGDTEMGRDLLAQDYLLKQLTASLMYPEEELGSEFWQRVRQKAMKEFGITDIPVNTFNKVWIVPEKAFVYEYQNSAYVIDSHLKVMLEEDYRAMAFHQNATAQSRAPARDPARGYPVKDEGRKTKDVEGTSNVSHLTSNIIKEILIPEIEREVNEGETFAKLRQIYNAMILATWYKMNLKESLLGKVYVDQNKTKGIDTGDKQVNQKIYEQYLEAFQKGVYNYIKEDYDPATQSIVPKKYFSGGVDLAMLSATNMGQPVNFTVETRPPAELSRADSAMIVDSLRTGIDPQGLPEMATRVTVDLVEHTPGNEGLVGGIGAADAAMLTFKLEELEGSRKEHLLGKIEVAKEGAESLWDITESVYFGEIHVYFDEKEILASPANRDSIEIANDILRRIKSEHNAPGTVFTVSALEGDDKVMIQAINVPADAAMTARTIEIDRKWIDQLRPYYGDDQVINDQTLEIMASLTAKHAGAIRRLLATRVQKQRHVDEVQGSGFRFLNPNRKIEDAYGNKIRVKDVRKGDWEVKELPEELTRPGAILTGPWSDEKWAMNALNSGAVRLFYDQEDAGWDYDISSIISAYVAKQIIHGRITEYTNPETGRTYTVPPRDQWPVVTHRVRGIHFDSKFFEYNGEKIPAIIEDIVTYVVNNHEALRSAGSGVYLVIPKLQTAEEVKVVAEILGDLEKILGMNEGTIRFVLMNETIELTLELEEALWAARKHVALSNVGRWDKMATDIRFRRAKSDEIMPDPTSVTMSSPHMKEYVERNTAIALKRGALPEGGMVVQMKSRGGEYPETDQWVEETVIKDKTAEREAGMRSAWVATPQLAKLVNEIFQAGDYEELERRAMEYEVKYDAKALKRLLQLPEGEVTKEGVRKAVYDSLAYMIGYRTSGGAVAIVDESRPGLRLMQDLAVLKINYYWLWTLARHGVKLSDTGETVTHEYLRDVIDSQIEHIKELGGLGIADHFSDADWNVVGDLLDRLISSKQMFLWESIAMRSVLDETDPQRIEQILDEQFSDAAMTAKSARSIRKKPFKGDQYAPIYYFGDFGERINKKTTGVRGDTTKKKILGGKGANLAEMAEKVAVSFDQFAKKELDRMLRQGEISQDEHTRLLSAVKLRVPPGFTITTEQTKRWQERGRRISNELMGQMMAALEALEEFKGQSLGNRDGSKGMPLLVSVRSGAPESMPGMMDTILNLGLNKTNVRHLAEATSEKFAWDAYRRFIEMYGRTVLEFDDDEKAKTGFKFILENKIEEKGVPDEYQLSAQDYQELVDEYLSALAKVGMSIPDDPVDQYVAAVETVMRSTFNERALIYREKQGIKEEDAISAVNVLPMIFGNRNERSGSGVMFTRDLQTGEPVLNAEWALNAQGEDVVSGRKAGRSLEELRHVTPEIAINLEILGKFLEQHFGNVQDMEFTFEHDPDADGGEGETVLYMLQTRNAKRTAMAEFVTAYDMVQEGLISTDKAVQRITPGKIEELLVPRFDQDQKEAAIKEGRLLSATGLNASPGAGVGRIVFSAEEAIALHKDIQRIRNRMEQGLPVTEQEIERAKHGVILMRDETSPDDVGGMEVTTGIATRKGGRTSHAAVVARQLGVPAVVGDENMVIDFQNETVRFSSPEGKAVTLNKHAVVSIDGTGEKGKGQIIQGALETIDSIVTTAQIREHLGEIEERAGILEKWIAQLSDEDPIKAEYQQYLAQYRAFIDQYKDKRLSEEELAFYEKYKAVNSWRPKGLGVGANAEAPLDVFNAILNGAQRLGLVRTEHMFSDSGQKETDGGESRTLKFQKMIFAKNETERREALEVLRRLQQADFEQIFMNAAAVGAKENGRPVTIRLVDPPLHEFLPGLRDTDENNKAIAKLANALGINEDEIRRKIRTLRDQNKNPMFGTRGSRLSILMPEIIEMQSNAIFDAMRHVRQEGFGVDPEIMVPLIGNVEEFRYIKEIIERVGQQQNIDRGDYKIGTMIEIMAAAVNSAEIAKEAEFYSFGTNDFTQGALKISRDDGKEWLFRAQETGVFDADPFVSLVPEVAAFIKRTLEAALSVNPDLRSFAKCGICGEQGVDPKSIEDFLAPYGLDYVSGGSRRIPGALFAAAQQSFKDLTPVQGRDIQFYQPDLKKFEGITSIQRAKTLEEQFKQAIVYVRAEGNFPDAKRTALANINLSKPNGNLDPEGIDTVLRWTNEVAREGLPVRRKAKMTEPDGVHPMAFITTEEIFYDAEVRPLVQWYLLLNEMNLEDTSQNRKLQKEKDNVLKEIESLVRKKFADATESSVLLQDHVAVRLPNIAFSHIFEYASERESKERLKVLRNFLEQFNSDISLHDVENLIENYHESNTAIGQRGSRVFFTKNSALYNSLARAVVRGADDVRVRTLDIILPFIVNDKEVQVIRQGYRNDRGEVLMEGLDDVIVQLEPSTEVRIGANIETPAAVVTAAGIAKETDGQIVIHARRLTEAVWAAFEDDMVNGGVLDKYRELGIWKTDIYKVTPPDVRQLIVEAIQSVKKAEPAKEIALVVDGQDVELIQAAYALGADKLYVEEEDVPLAMIGAIHAVLTVQSDLDAAMTADEILRELGPQISLIERRLLGDESASFIGDEIRSFLDGRVVRATALSNLINKGMGQEIAEDLLRQAENLASQPETGTDEDTDTAMLSFGYNDRPYVTYALEHAEDGFTAQDAFNDIVTREVRLTEIVQIFKRLVEESILSVDNSGRYFVKDRQRLSEIVDGFNLPALEDNAQLAVINPQYAFETLNSLNLVERPDTGELILAFWQGDRGRDLPNDFKGMPFDQVLDAFQSYLARQRQRHREGEPSRTALNPMRVYVSERPGAPITMVGLSLAGGKDEQYAELESLAREWLEFLAEGYYRALAPAKAFPQDVVVQTAAQLTVMGLRGAYAEVEAIASADTVDADKIKDLLAFFQKLSETTGGHPKIQAAIDALNVIDELGKEQLAILKRSIKDTADGIAKRIYEQTVKREGIILLVRVSEGYDRDGVEESLRSNEVIVPDELRSESREIRKAIENGDILYVSTAGQVYPIVDATVDVIEGTNMFVTNSGNKTLGQISQAESGSTSVIVTGPGVRSLGNAPDGYVGQFITNVGDSANLLRNLKVDVLGQVYSLTDPELYAVHPQSIIEYLRALATFRGQDLADLQEEIVVMDRDREQTFLNELERIKENYNIKGLTITKIKDGTVVHGLKAAMTPEMFKEATGRNYGKHKTMITIGGSAEGFMVLAIAGALRETGAVGGGRIYSGKMNKNAAGETMRDHSQRYAFTEKERADIQTLRDDAEAILTGKKLLTEQDVQGDVQGAFSFISTNGVFRQPGTIAQVTQQKTSVLEIVSVDGEAHAEIGQIITKVKAGSDAAMTASPVASDLSLVTSASDQPQATSNFTKGGIDLNPALLDLQIKRDGNGIPLPLDQQPLMEMNIEGFIPVIINVTPVTNLPLLLGFVDTESPSDVGYELAPGDRKARFEIEDVEEVSMLN